MAADRMHLPGFMMYTPINRMTLDRADPEDRQIGGFGSMGHWRDLRVPWVRKVARLHQHDGNIRVLRQPPGDRCARFPRTAVSHPAREFGTGLW